MDRSIQDKMASTQPAEAVCNLSEIINLAARNLFQDFLKNILDKI